MDRDRENTVLAKLPNGVCLVSSLIPDQSPPRHVYCVLGADGAVLREHTTLLEMIKSVDDF